MEYQIWDTEAGTYLGKFSNERAAMSLVKKLIDHFGDDYAESLSMGRVGEDGSILPALSGAELRAHVHNVDAIETELRHPNVVASTRRSVA